MAREKTTPFGSTPYQVQIHIVRMVIGQVKNGVCNLDGATLDSLDKFLEFRKGSMTQTKAAMRLDALCGFEDGHGPSDILESEEQRKRDEAEYAAPFQED